MSSIHKTEQGCCSEVMLKMISWTPRTMKLWDFMGYCGIEKAIILIYALGSDLSWKCDTLAKRGSYRTMRHMIVTKEAEINIIIHINHTKLLVLFLPQSFRAFLKTQLIKLFPLTFTKKCFMIIIIIMFSAFVVFVLCLRRAPRLRLRISKGNENEEKQ